MKDKLKKIITIIFIVFAILFGFSWVKSCNNAKDIKTYENVAQMRQKAPKRANEQEDFGSENKDYIIFDSDIIEKVEIESEEYIAEDGKVTIDLWYFLPDYQYDLKIYFKKGFAYQETTNINDNFILSTLNNEDIAFSVLDYKSTYNYSTMRIDYEFNEDIAQVTTITLKEELIKHNFDYLTNKSLILNSSLSSQIGNNLCNENIAKTDNWHISLGDASVIQGETYTININASLSSSQGSQLKIGDKTIGFASYQYSGNIATFTALETASGELWLNGTYTDLDTLPTQVMLNKGSYALPYHKYIDISDNNDKVRIQPKNDNLIDRTFATYFYSNSYKTLIPKYENIPIISLENNTLGFAIGTGTETTIQAIYDYNNNVYLNAYGLIPRTLSFSNQFNHDNLNCFVLNYYQEGYADYENEILFTEYLLNNSQPFTSEQIDTYNIGYQIGKSDGIYQSLEWTNLIKELAKSLESFLNIQILPNITIKLLILVPLMFSILSFIIKLFVK